MYRIKNKNIYLNRGDAIKITVVNNNDVFSTVDYLKFYICEAGNMGNVLLEKRFEVPEESATIDINLTSEETRLGDPLKTGSRAYWYEIELNGDTTLVGYDADGPKLFILYPEAVSSESEV